MMGSISPDTGGSMVVAAGAMGMTVCDLVRCGISNVDDLDVEMEGLACQRVIGIDVDDIFFDLGDPDIKDFTGTGLDGKCHAGFDGDIRGKCASVYGLRARLLVLAIGFRRRDDSLKLVAGLVAGHVSFKARYDIPRAVKIGEGVGTN